MKIVYENLRDWLAIILFFLLVNSEDLLRLVGSASHGKTSFVNRELKLQQLLVTNIYIWKCIALYKNKICNNFPLCCLFKSHMMPNGRDDAFVNPLHVTRNYLQICLIL